MQPSPYDAFPARGEYYTDARDGNDAQDSDRDSIIGDPDNPTEIVTYAPKEAFRLGYFDVMCLVMNRMIGTCVLCV